MITYTNELVNREQNYEKYNDQYITMAVERAVENILIPYKHKLKCFEDEDGKKPRHPRD